ncbi:hypothetical protein PP1Y_AT2792 [Novosphingobium sp. PP1Y]|nr:hypothetical protein PP1Y_AT2792 [Novosphingobium sp. PP1Y]
MHGLTPALDVPLLAKVAINAKAFCLAGEIKWQQSLPPIQSGRYLSLD